MNVYNLNLEYYMTSIIYLNEQDGVNKVKLKRNKNCF